MSRMRPISPISSALSCGFMPAAGSSRRSSFGFAASARAISSRRWYPYGRFRAHSSFASRSPTNWRMFSGVLGHLPLLRAHARRAENGADHAGFRPAVLADQDVLHRGHLAEEPDVLERAGHAERGNPVGRQAGDVFRLEGDGAGGRRGDARDAVEESRLARAVRADKSDDLVVPDAADVCLRWRAGPRKSW